MSAAVLAQFFIVEVGESQLGCPDGDRIGGLALCLRRQPRTKPFDLCVVRNVPWIHNTPSAEQLVSRIVPDGPFDLAVGQVVKPLEEQGPQWTCSLSFLPSHHLLRAVGLGDYLRTCIRDHLHNSGQVCYLRTYLKGEDWFPR
jgi:hypothetical protein